MTIVWNNFIVLEGLDGAGTTTQAKLLADTLRAEGKSVWLTAEPTNGRIGREIRDILKSGDAPCNEAMAFLFAADRAEHLYGKDGVREHLDAGDIVISDRYAFSSLAYQNVGTTNRLADHVNERFPLPELAFLLDVPATECMKRISARGAATELYEKRRFLEEARSCYEYIWPVQYPVIDGTMSVREIEKMIRDAVLRRITAPTG